MNTGRGSIVFAVREIDWIEAENNYSRLWIGARSHLLREPMRSLEQRVGGDFVRAHRRALIRLDAVRALTVTSHGDLVAELRSGAKVPVSRRRRAAFAAAVRAI